MAKKQRATEAHQTASKPHDDRLNRRAASANHRLRGTEFTDDFVDADADSSVVVTHRDDKQSDS